MDPFTSAVTVLAAVGMAIKVSKQTFNMVNGARQAPPQIRRLAIELQSLYTLLATLQSLIARNREQHDSIIVDMLDNLGSLIRNCLEVFKDIQRTLMPFMKTDGKASIGLWQAFTYSVFSRNDVKALQQTLESYKAMLHMSCTALSVIYTSTTNNLANNIDQTTFNMHVRLQEIHHAVKRLERQFDARDREEYAQDQALESSRSQVETSSTGQQGNGICHRLSIVGYNALLRESLRSFESIISSPRLSRIQGIAIAKGLEISVDAYKDKKSADRAMRLPDAAKIPPSSAVGRMNRSLEKVYMEDVGYFDMVSKSTQDSEISVPTFTDEPCIQAPEAKDASYPLPEQSSWSASTVDDQDSPTSSAPALIEEEFHLPTPDSKIEWSHEQIQIFKSKLGDWDCCSVEEFGAILHQETALAALCKAFWEDYQWKPNTERQGTTQNKLLEGAEIAKQFLDSPARNLVPKTHICTKGVKCHKHMKHKAKTVKLGEASTDMRSDMATVGIDDGRFAPFNLAFPEPNAMIPVTAAGPTPLTQRNLSAFNKQALTLIAGALPVEGER
ncbi:uncharacterized protein KY384_004994 [Bacidia gigantensis]|uniref:uncharacterized protein n=1 Tax=Bacidia gigantensis TaxID=2732470 RepID=UPI001D05750D|nr:uncharacterized protein KY384_004994 [Bacidia gigantensis]KAG8530491.1 hypothetical protein KY384_004994 [Bacidia gigantensis]